MDHMRLYWNFILLTVLILLCFITPSYAMDVTLTWNPNSEGDLAGYKVYYWTGASAQSYDGTDAYQGPSPITLPIEDLYDLNNPEYTLSNLDDTETYYFVGTAYNDEGIESSYSNQRRMFYYHSKMEWYLIIISKGRDNAC
jgi:hypothetical protein